MLRDHPINVGLMSYFQTQLVASLLVYSNQAHYAILL